ncbi:MAG: M15 family metallopeptidase [Bacilli bacterium]|nr:M15 family metallopeptidase [Bacilli bacterium]
MTKRKRRKLKKKRIIILLSILLVITSITIYLLIPKTYGYQKEVINVFKETETYDKLKEKKEYSKVLEYSVLENVFKKEYFDTYFEINYIEEVTRVTDINALLDLGYTSNEINTFYEKLPNSINVIINNEYNKNIINYITLDYFNEENLDRYIKYDNDANKLESVYDTTIINDNYTYEDTVTFVNAYLDKDYYTNDINLTNEEANNIDIIVNKYYKLNSNYEPSDLTKINSKYSSGNNQRLRKEAATKFEEMAQNALDNGLKIYAGSTYRSYSYQLGLYNRYVLKDGFAEAETYSARAGYSEHQLGLAVDILNGKWSYLSETDKEYTWLIDNSYKYGYILRYPRGKEYVTGYVFEDWHFRYLGIELATKVYNSGLTYDEYIARNS